LQLFKWRSKLSRYQRGGNNKGEEEALEPPVAEINDSIPNIR